MSDVSPDISPTRADGAELKLERRRHEYQNGCIYDGTWKANRRYGEGTFTWPSGTVYKGAYKDDRRHG